MTGEDKPAGQTEQSKQSTPQSSEQQKPPVSKETGPVPPAVPEGLTSETAVTSKVNRSTEKLKVGELAGLPQALPLSFGGDPGSAKWFRRLPVSMSTSELPPETPRWRIELVGLAPTVEPMGVEVVGDTVIGRGRVGTEPADLDLDMYGALEKGVSRRHSLFRPTTNHLYIIDLGSTNGTLHNGIPLGPGVARALKHNDTITLGRFSFTIKIVDGPTIRKAVEPEGQSAVTSSALDADQTQPLKVIDIEQAKGKKARLAPPTFDASSPETAKLAPDEAAKPQDQASTAEAKITEIAEKEPAPETKAPSLEEKRPVSMDELPTPPGGMPKVNIKSATSAPVQPAPPSGIPKVEGLPPDQEAKPSEAESQASSAEAQPPATEDKSAGSGEKPPAAESKPQVDEAKPSAKAETLPDKTGPEKRGSILGE